jgi:hypothetical protein
VLIERESGFSVEAAESFLDPDIDQEGRWVLQVASVARSREERNLPRECSLGVRHG